MKLREAETMETPVSALIDVVFQLILFFILTSSMDKDAVDEEIKLAQAKHAKAVTTANPGSVIVNVRKDGTINIAKMSISPNVLRQMLVGMRTNYGQNVPIIIRADGNARYEYVSKVQDIITESGFYKVKLVAEVASKGK